MTCLNTCHDATQHIATLTQVNKKLQSQIKFVRKELDQRNSKIGTLQAKNGTLQATIDTMQAEEHQESPSDGKYYSTCFSDTHFIIENLSYEHLMLTPHTINTFDTCRNANHPTGPNALDHTTG